MVWLNRSRIPVGRRGVISLFQWFLPAFPRVEGGGGSAPCDQCREFRINATYVKKMYHSLKFLCSRIWAPNCLMAVQYGVWLITGLVCIWSSLFLSMSTVRWALVLCVSVVFDFVYACNQCCGSMTFWCVSGSADPCLWIMDPDPAIFVIDLQDANKKRIKKNSAYYFLKVPTFTSFFKDKKSKSVTK